MRTWCPCALDVPRGSWDFLGPNTSLATPQTIREEGDYMAVQDEVPKSRITLRYRTEINGTPADIDLPLRLLMLGDFSQGTSADRKLDLEERKARNLDGTNTGAVMKD